MPSDQDVYRAADDVHEALVALIETIPEDAIAERDWEFGDEDWVRDAILGAAHYAHWRATGVHGFIYLAPGLDPGRELGDTMATALAYLIRYDGADIEGWTVAPSIKAGGEEALRSYEVQRQQEPDEHSRRGGLQTARPID